VVQSKVTAALVPRPRLRIQGKIDLSKIQLVAIIDDDASVRATTDSLVRSFGYVVNTFASAEEFVDGGGEGSCDCIITDFNMPRMGGLDLIQLLADRGSTVPVIMVTGRSEPGLDAKAAAGGVVGLLMKPFEEDALIRCLEKALRI